MKEYGEIPEKVYCNMCGSKIEKAAEGIFHDHLSVNKNWGYFSDKDGENHSFELCEKCYDNFVNQFKIPVDSKAYMDYMEKH